MLDDNITFAGLEADTSKLGERLLRAADEHKVARPLLVRRRRAASVAAAAAPSALVRSPMQLSNFKNSRYNSGNQMPAQSLLPSSRGAIGGGQTHLMRWLRFFYSQ